MLEAWEDDRANQTRSGAHGARVSLSGAPAMPSRISSRALAFA